MLQRALEKVREVVAGGGRVLFVGTKRQAAEIIAESAKKSGQYYVNHRWLGGMLTNWKTISNSIRRLRELEEKFANGDLRGLTKKEQLNLEREREKLDRAIGGIKDMGGLPDVVFVIDTMKEALAIAEANKLGIPVIAILDSNSDPKGVEYPVPGNDDAIRAIKLYADLIAGAVLTGLQAEASRSGVDVGAAFALPAEDALLAAAEVAAVVEAPVAEAAVSA